MYTLPNEVLIPTGLSNLVLTNMRIRATEGGYLDSMFLRELSSIHYSHTEKPAYVWAGIIFAVLAAWMFQGGSGSEMTAVPAAAAVVSFVLYFKSRRTSLKIVANGGGAISLRIRANSIGEVTALVDKIEGAKVGS